MSVNELKQSVGPSPNGVSKKPTVCVFCGASGGNSPEHLEAARDLGRALHKHGINLVYGGGTDGVMGEIAKTLVSLSGKDAVHGVIPEALLKYERRYGENGTERAAQELVDENTYGRTTVVKDMHTRKQMMAREAIDSGFISKSNSGIMAEARTAEDVVYALKNYTKSTGRFDLNWGEK